MSPKLSSAYRQNAGLLAVLASIATLAAGCATHRSADAPAANASVATSGGAGSGNADEGPSPPITAMLPDLPPEGTEVVSTQPTTVVNASAPRSYTVQRGDTLWGLANMFLRDPWLWPEIWYVNPQINNPHLIYPGDVLTLVQGRDGSVSQIQLTRGPVTRLSPTLRNGGVNADGSVASVPYEAIRAFLSRPGIITGEEIKTAPYVLSIRDGHLVGGLNNDVYVKGPVRGIGERYNVMHIEQPLRGGDGGKKVGYMTVYAGGAQLTRSGDPATAHVTESDREVQIGDVLVPNTPTDTAAIIPHAPTRDINARIVAVAGGVKLVGNYQVVALDAGSAQGMEVGYVLRAWSVPQSANDRCKRINGQYSCNRWGQVRLPAESAGTMLVFKVLDQVSYALVVAVDVPVRINDRVSKP
jgi:LysM repeat protein